MNEKYNEICTCEVCGNNKLIPVLNLGEHPMCDDLISITDDRKCKEYPIEILFCDQCKTAHQRFQVPKHELFPSTYHYRSRFTADVINGMSELVNSCIKHSGSLKGKIVLDIGCNDGSLLDFFGDNGALTIGIEPTDAYLDALNKGHSIYNNFLSEEIAGKIIKAHGKPDIITFTNVFAHIENLHEVLSSVKKLMSENTLIVIENHYLGSVLDGNQFDTFYHEHPRTYSFNSFVHMAATLEASLMNVEFPSRYGGNIRVFIGQINNNEMTIAKNIENLNIKEEKYLGDFTRLSNNIAKWKESKYNFITNHVKKHGELRAKAFPGRAAILIKLLGLDENLISAVYEKPGSLKIGNCLPGTRIPILSDNDLFSQKDVGLPILNLAWHIPNEIRDYLKLNNYHGEVYDIIGSHDFE